MRSRLLAAARIAIAIAVGLASRRPPLVAFLGKYPGDALWALMMLYIVGFVAPAATLRRRALVALGICYAIELSQLYEPPWLVTIRATTLGHLVLGSAFHVADLLAYTAGIAAGIALEQGWKVLRRAA